MMISMDEYHSCKYSEIVRIVTTQTDVYLKFPEHGSNHRQMSSRLEQKLTTETNQN